MEDYTPAAGRTSPAVSVVVPLFNEAKSLPHLVREVRAVLDDRFEWELILVDDGSKDETAEVAGRLASGDPRIRPLRLARNYGQTQALQAGFDHARGEIVVSMDGDLQNDPADIPRLVGRLEEGYDLVAGNRQRREEPFLTRTFPSRAANALICRLTGVPVRDNGCSLKVYRREVLERMHIYAEQHRFVAPLAAATTGARMCEIPVRHRERRFGRSKYGLSRTWRVLADLVTLKLLRSFRDRPLLFFGLGAVFFVGAAGVFGLTDVAMRTTALGASELETFVFPTVGLLCLGVAVFLLMLGLIAEVAVLGEWSPATSTGPVVREWDL